MVFQDRSITCAECGQAFIFTADDQRYHLEKGYSDPKRCPSCRRSRRAQLDSRGGEGYGRGPRQMYPAVCAQCGAETEVPFLPRGDRPVYCSDCYSKQRRNLR
jgi:CxxC-x17-CxxC domain-containing protein